MRFEDWKLWTPGMDERLGAAIREGRSFGSVDRELGLRRGAAHQRAISQGFAAVKPKATLVMTEAQRDRAARSVGIAFAVARLSWRPGKDRDELLSMAMWGLIRAAITFDPAKNPEGEAAWGDFAVFAVRRWLWKARFARPGSCPLLDDAARIADRDAPRPDAVAEAHDEFLKAIRSVRPTAARMAVLYLGHGIPLKDVAAEAGLESRRAGHHVSRAVATMRKRLTETHA